MRLIIPGSQVSSITPATRDEKLVALIAEAQQARQLILANPERSPALPPIMADAGRGLAS